MSMLTPSGDLISPWHPITDPVDLKHIGKLQEELSEFGAALARCLIQGFEESHPVSGKPNKQWIEEELADLETCIKLLKERFQLNIDPERARRKEEGFRIWHAGA